MNTHRIRRVAKLTGLSKDVIRVWERRYELVKPSRSSNRYREYSDEDVLLLRFVKGQIDLGIPIGTIAAEGRDALVEQMRAATPVSEDKPKPHDRLIDDLMGLLNPLDKVGFERKLNGAVAVIPFEEALDRILLPLQIRIGEMWHEGRLNISVEHFVTKLLQQKLFSVMNQLPTHEKGPRVLIACPSGEIHELGAQAVAYMAASRGCHVHYLGPNLPSAALQIFCRLIKPQLVLLSLTEIPTDEKRQMLLEELTPIADHWPLAIGGHGAQAIAKYLYGTHIELISDLASLHHRIQKLKTEREADF
ncbi:MAG: hypothetical protein RL768_2513 [Nitrospirota bacterium]